MRQVFKKQVQHRFKAATNLLMPNSLSSQITLELKTEQSKRREKIVTFDLD